MDTLSYKTVSANAATVEKQWVIVDAQAAVLGRLASEVAKILRGKTKPSFTPHADCGDNVIVINTDKIRLTGDKWDSKVYVRHTGYPGGQRISTPRLLKERSSTILIEKAVR
ncbi:MAG: 50S ribosomal protein L13, partial [Algoriphagus sp.]